jgi:hypothetical protein
MRKAMPYLKSFKYTRFIDLFAMSVALVFVIMEIGLIVHCAITSVSSQVPAASAVIHAVI